MKNALSIVLIKMLLVEMERLQHQHPKAKILYDIERERIEITYPLPRDFIKYQPYA